MDLLKPNGISILLIGLIGVVIRILVPKKFAIISMDDEVATSLGTNVQLVKISGIIAVLLLSGVVVSAGGYWFYDS